MGVSRNDSISKYGTEAYTGWGEAEAAADARAKGRSGGGNNLGDYGANLEEFNQSIDKYVNELIAQSQGDYDFAAKWIEANFKKALGTDDTERANFLKSVANDLEKKVGTVAFDYKTNTYKVTSDRDLALQRLNEDEQTLKRTVQQERIAQGGNLNQRGILSSTRDNATGLAGSEVSNYEAGVNDRMASLQRARENINIGSERSLEDITTTSRRGAQVAVDTNTYQTEEAKRQLAKQKALAEANRSTMKAQVVPYAYANS